MLQSTTTIGFDQHAHSLVAALLLPDAREPAIQPLSPDLPHVGRFIDKVLQQGPVPRPPVHRHEVVGRQVRPVGAHPTNGRFPRLRTRINTISAPSTRPAPDYTTSRPSYTRS